MKIQFDLRPAGVLEKERKKTSFNATRTLAILLMLAFFASSCGYIVMMTFQLIWLQEEVEYRENVVSGLESERMLLQRQVGELQAREIVFRSTLQIMQEDLPTIEVLGALESNMDDYGFGFNTLRFVTGDVVEVTGMAASDRQIIDFSERLSASGIFSDVFLPVTTLNEQTGMISFTLRMPHLSVGQIQALR